MTITVREGVESYLAIIEQGHDVVLEVEHADMTVTCQVFRLSDGVLKTRER